MSSVASTANAKNPTSVGGDSSNAYEMNFHRDFEPLQMASKVILSALRSDEAAPGSDLYRRLASSTSGDMSSSASPSHVYFASEKWTRLDSSANKSSASSSHTSDNRSNRIGIGAHSATSPGTPGFRSPKNRTPTISSPWAHIGRSSSGNTPKSNQPSFTSPSSKTVHFDKGLHAQPSRSSTLHNSNASNPTKSTPTTIFEHHHSIPLPSYLSNLVSNVKVASLMGLLPEANLAWMSVDEKLYVWAYDTEENNQNMENGMWSPSKRTKTNNRMEDFCTFVPPSQRNIVSVGLVRPRKGVFKDNVKWCLVVTTDDEAILCAITTSSSPQKESFGSSSLRLIPTRFYISTDSVPMVSIAGTPDGRIFLGGYDGCLYELQYEGTSTFTNFSSTSSLSSKIYSGGKRAFGSAIPSGLLPGSSSSNSHQPYKKCRKLNHTNKAPIFHSLLPGFVQKLMTSGNGPIIDICVDPERNSLYTLTSKGVLHCHNLSSKKMDMEMASSVDLLKLAKSYLNAVARGLMYPPNSSIRFPGGGTAAAKGVGGMEGARSLLKASENESEQEKNAGVSTGRVLTPTSLHIITKKESRSLTLLAITGAGVRFYLSSLGQFDMSGPGKHIYLCHVRAPPLIQDILVEKENGMHSRSNNERILPGYNAFGGRRRPTPNAMASFYRNGTMIVALDGNQVLNSSRGNHSRSDMFNSEQNSQSDVGGDLILASTPDFAGRRLDTVNTGYNTVSAYSMESNTGNNNRTTVAGGLSESLNIPFSSTGSSQSQLLPGGRVWEIASPSSKAYVYNNKENQGPMLHEQLFWASTTPSDSELNIGLIPAIVSPSSNSIKRRKLDIASHQSTSTAIAHTNKGMFSSAIALIGYIINGTRNIDATLSPNDISKKWKMPKYNLAPVPLSVSYGSNMNTGRKHLTSTKGRVQRGSKSSISSLPRWLLKPEICPLEEVSVHHLSTSYDAPPRNVLALNSGGLHFFSRQSILDQLASCLYQGNPPDSPAIRSFFETYGNKEGCAMALALAIYKQNAGSKLLSNQAVKAALNNAQKPKLVPAFGSSPDPNTNRPNQFNTAMTTNPNNTNDKVLINGQHYEFKPSSLHNGLVSFISRLLRPIWFKPAILVTPSKIRNSPAKVEFLLDEATLEELRRPLHTLQSILRSVFDPAVSVVPGLKTKNKDPNAMDIDEGDHTLITRALQFQSQSIALENDVSNGYRHTSSKELETEARLLEEKSLHNLYRLVSRTVQLLSLLNLLRRAQDLPSLPEVEWGLLHGLYFQQLVVLPKAQERIQSLLSSLVSSSLTDDDGIIVSPVFNNSEADTLAKTLESEAYLYFSAGDRLTFQGFQAARAALSFSQDSANRYELSNKAGKLLSMAARHWQSPSLVSGRIMNQQGVQRDSPESIAISNSSPLAKAANVLMSIGNVGAIVDICLVCASNFGGTLRGTSVEADSAVINGWAHQSSSMLPWEVGLYHGQSSSEKQLSSDTNSAAFSQTQVTSPTHPMRAGISNQAIVVSGFNVTPIDARRSCYSVILFHLGELLRAQTPHQRQLGQTMLSVSVTSFDELFQNTLFSFLLNEDFVETLLLIENPRLESWLIEEIQNYSLLWRYYIIHGKHIAAADVMYSRATSDSDAVTLDERIECLTRAVNSLKSATETVDKGDYALRLGDVEEQLDIARLQKRILSAVVENNLSTQNQGDIERKLLGVNELYNTYAAGFGLYEICLSIIQSCKMKNHNVIETLWKSILSKEVPMLTKSPAAEHVLKRMRDATPLADQDILNDGNFFENGNWISNLKEIVIKTGKEVYGKGADYTFPLFLLASILEDLREAYEAVQSTNSTSNPWPLHCFIEVGIGFPSILECYVDLHDNIVRERVNPDKRLQCLLNIGEILKYWILAASLHSMGSVGTTLSINVPREIISKARNDSGLQLSRTLSSGLLSRIDLWKGSVESLLGGEAQKANKVLALFSDIEHALHNFMQV